MGSRATYVLIEHSAITAYAEHWGAQTVPRLIASGPAETISHFHDLMPVKWLPYGSGAEGGILVDDDTRTLIFWGGEDINYSPYLRRLFLPVLRRLWQGWAVSWAMHGILDFAEYPSVAESLGVDLARLIQDCADIDWHPFPESVVREPSERKWNATLITVKWEDGRVTDYILDSIPPVYLLFGSPLLEVLREREPDAPPREDGSDMYHATPEGGAYIDVAEHTLWAWDFSTIDPVRQQLVAQAWLGWRVEWHIDGVAHQVALSGRDPVLVTPPISVAGADLLIQLLDSEFRIDAAQFATLIEDSSDPATARSTSTFAAQESHAMTLEQRAESLLQLVVQVAREQAHEVPTSWPESRG